MTLTRAQLEAALKEINAPESNNIQPGDFVQWVYGVVVYKMLTMPYPLEIPAHQFLLLNLDTYMVHAVEKTIVNDPKQVKKVGAPR